MIEMPELFERHMTLGKQSFEDKEYNVARDHFNQAYNLKDDEIANLYLTNTLLVLEKYQEAYEVMSEKKKYYLQEPQFQEVYFQLLIKMTLFLEVEKFLIQTTHVKREDWEKVYQVTKEYHLTVNKEKILEKERELADIGSVSLAKQKQRLKLIHYLPKESFLALTKVVLIDSGVSLLVKSEWINQLTQLNVNENLETMTWQGVVVPFNPNDYVPLKQVYANNQVLNQLTQYFDNSDPSLKEMITSEVKLHIGCLYPFEEVWMNPRDIWVSSYLIKSGLSEGNSDLSTELRDVLNCQKEIEEKLMQSMLFHE